LVVKRWWLLGSHWSWNLLNYNLALQDAFNIFKFFFSAATFSCYLKAKWQRQKLQLCFAWIDCSNSPTLVSTKWLILKLGGGWFSPEFLQFFTLFLRGLHNQGFKISWLNGKTIGPKNSMANIHGVKHFNRHKQSCWWAQVVCLH